MNKNYIIYPLKYMRITQTYLGNASHIEHTTGSPKDYPIDDGGKDSGKDAIYCPCDEMEVTAIKGYQNNNVTNTIWLVSTTKVVTPTFEDIVFMTLTHSNDEDIKDIKIGQKFKRGEIISYEGNDLTSANHVHITVGRGYSNDWEENSNGKWVISGQTKKPEEVFFIDPTFTTVLNNANLQFIKLDHETIGTPVEKNPAKKQLEIVVENLNARSKPSTTSLSLGYVNKGIYNYSEVVISADYTWYKIENFWVAYNKSWINILEHKNEEIKLIFESHSSKYYKIFLKENTKLYLKE